MLLNLHHAEDLETPDLKLFAVQVLSALITTSRPLLYLADL
jgi:hypothetical protein